MPKGKKISGSSTQTVSVKFPNDLVAEFDRILGTLHQRDRSYVIRQLCLKGLKAYKKDSKLEEPELEALYFDAKKVSSADKQVIAKVVAEIRADKAKTK